MILGLKHLAGGWGELWGKIRDTTAAFVNPIIGIINGLIDAMNKLPGVDLGKTGKIGQGNGAAAAVPELQHGGIVRRPTLALLGEGARKRWSPWGRE